MSAKPKVFIISTLEVTVNDWERNFGISSLPLDEALNRLITTFIIEGRLIEIKLIESDLIESDLIERKLIKSDLSILN